VIWGAERLYLAIPALAAWYFTRQGCERKRLLLTGVCVLPLAYLAGKTAGYVYYNPRPFAAGGFLPLVRHAADNGLPSEHTLFCAAISAVVFTSHKKFGAALWALTLTVGVCRVAAGVHHSADVAGAALIAVCVTWVVSRGCRRTFGLG